MGDVSDVYYDPYDFEIDADPYPVWRRMRDEAPLYHNEKYDFFALSRFDDVEAALKDWKTYSSAKGTLIELIKADIDMPPGSIIFEDPPAHTRHRSILSRVFTPKRMLEIEPKVREYCADWATTQRRPGGEASPLRVEIERDGLLVSFEPEHLRRVLINLLDNGLRHARPGPGALRVQLGEDREWVRLSVFSRAEPIPAEVERHLFEPFFSTRSRGSGLGLYICRELCERYGARIEYHRRDTGPNAEANEFRVLLPRPASPGAALASVPSAGPDSHFPDTELHER